MKNFKKLRPKKGYLQLFIIFIAILGICAIYRKHTNASPASSAHFFRRVDQLLPYGEVVNRTVLNDKNAIVERVNLFVKENESSENMIIRPGILTRYPTATATVVICHGFMCDKYDVAFLRKLFPRGKYNILTFDFRAHGEQTDGQICTFGKDEVYDVIAAVNFIKNHPELTNNSIIGYSFSMGAATTIEAQSKENSLFDVLILDCPFASTEKVIQKALETIKFSFFGYEFGLPVKHLWQQCAFHPLVQSIIKRALKTVVQINSKDIPLNIQPVYPVESAKKITIPCLVVHCKNDEKIDVADVEHIYNQLGGYKQLWVTEGRRHYDSFFYDPERYIARIRRFLQEVANRQENKQRDELTESNQMLL